MKTLAHYETEDGEWKEQNLKDVEVFNFSINGFDLYMEMVDKKTSGELTVYVESGDEILFEGSVAEFKGLLKRGK